MQLQIECSGARMQQPCWICDRPFERQEAQVILCNDQGVSQGEVCPHCLSKGFQWLNYRFEQLSKPKKPVLKTWHPSLSERIGA